MHSIMHKYAQQSRVIRCSNHHLQRAARSAQSFVYLVFGHYDPWSSSFRSDQRSSGRFSAGMLPAPAGQTFNVTAWKISWKLTYQRFLHWSLRGTDGSVVLGNRWSVTSKWFQSTHFRIADKKLQVKWSLNEAFFPVAPIIYLSFKENKRSTDNKKNGCQPFLLLPFYCAPNLSFFFMYHRQVWQVSCTCIFTSHSFTPPKITSAASTYLKPADYQSESWEPRRHI